MLSILGGPCRLLKHRFCYGSRDLGRRSRWRPCQGRQFRRRVGSNRPRQLRMLISRAGFQVFSAASGGVLLAVRPRPMNYAPTEIR